ASTATAALAALLVAALAAALLVAAPPPPLLSVPSFFVLTPHQPALLITSIFACASRHVPGPLQPTVSPLRLRFTSSSFANRMSPPSSMDAAEIAELRLDIYALLGPITSFIGSAIHSETALLTHMLSVEELLVSLHLMANKIHPRVFDAIVQPILCLEARLHEIKRAGHIEEDAATGSREWVRTEAGQMKIHLPVDLLIELLELGFSDKDSALFLGCSERTLRRRRVELDLQRWNDRDLSDEELSSIITQLQTMHSEDVGERGTWGALRSQGLRISRARLRRIVQATDPISQNPRWARHLKRRQYYVPFVNSLWHMDGHHKLIKWKIVIHGAIDGKSRLVTFLRASSNNRANTVAALFLEAVQARGSPSRVRGDHGGENMGVLKLMEEYRGFGRGSFIQGPSTRNQRIERLWVDVQKWTTKKYRAWFEHLEEMRVLDVDCDVHLWALHFVFLPQLNGALEHFVRMWNNHKMRTPGLGNQTPEQMFLQGAWDAARRGYDVGLLDMAERAAMQEVGLDIEGWEDYGLDGWRSERQGEQPHVRVDRISEWVPPVLNEPSTHAALRLLLPYPPFPPPADFGLTAYLDVLDAINDLI
ncbi:unnamed protein product, partial [Tilletia caries]